MTEMPPETRTLPIGSAAVALGVTRDNLYKHIERGRPTINGVPFMAQQGPDKRWKVVIPVDLTPFLPDEGQVGQEDEDGLHSLALSPEETIAQLRAELATVRQELAVACAERDSYRGLIQATHQATLSTLERVVEKLTQPPALPEPEPPSKKKNTFFSRRLFWFHFDGKEKG